MTIKNYKKQEQRRRQFLLNSMTSNSIAHVCDQYITWPNPKFFTRGRINGESEQKEKSKKLIFV